MLGRFSAVAFAVLFVLPVVLVVPAPTPAGDAHGRLVAGGLGLAALSIAGVVGWRNFPKT